MATSQELIGVLKEEYVRCQRHAGKLQKDKAVHQANTSSKPSILGQMKNADKCGHCGLHNHEAKDCKFLGQSKCGEKIGTGLINLNPK